MSNLFRRKLLNADLHDSGLKKCLSAFDLTLLGIGAIIGTGIFVLTGVAAATQAGPAVVLSFVGLGLPVPLPPSPIPNWRRALADADLPMDIPMPRSAS